MIALVADLHDGVHEEARHILIGALELTNDALGCLAAFGGSVTR